MKKFEFFKNRFQAYIDGIKRPSHAMDDNFVLVSDLQEAFNMAVDDTIEMSTNITPHRQKDREWALYETKHGAAVQEFDADLVEKLNEIKGLRI